MHYSVHERVRVVCVLVVVVVVEQPRRATACAVDVEQWPLVCAWRHAHTHAGTHARPHARMHGTPLLLFLLLLPLNDGGTNTDDAAECGAAS